MTKFFTAALAALVSSAVFAGTFVVPPNGEIKGNPDGTVSWSGVSLGSVVHFRDTNSAPVEHRVSGMSGNIKLQDVASYGGRFQVRDTNGNWAWLSPSGTRFTLAGAHLDCGNHDGCALEIDGTGPKSAPVANYPGGIYQGYAPAQQLASTDQRVAPNNGYAMTTAPSGAVVTPVTMVSSQTVSGGSSQSSAGKYKLVPVGVATSEAKKVSYKKPATKAPAVTKAAPEKCGGKPELIGDQLVQKPCESIYLGVPTPQVVAPASATPPAASAPEVPAATAKK